MSDGVICPICTREYELPRRFLVRADDIEFLPVPRKLGCLHTCCQSCLEEMWQKSNITNGISLRNTMVSGSVTCPQCQHVEVVDKSVRYLPLDASALADIVPLNGTNLSFCSRCHDEVPSYSWCGECSVSLCEFHHQDHKLSINTSRHAVKTFKDITRSRVVIEPRMPPISCPQELEQDATLYCQDCSLLLSAKVKSTVFSLIFFVDPQCRAHWIVTHSYCEASSLVDKSVTSVEKSMLMLEERERGLINAMKTITNTATKVKEDMSTSMRDIEVIFAKIHEDLELREHALLQRLQDVASRKTSILNGQLREMEDALEKCRHALNVSSDLLEKSTESAVRGGGLYVVGLAASIATRRDELDELVVGLPFEPQVDPCIRASFIKDDVDTVLSVLQSLGSVLTRDNSPAADNLEARSLRHEEDEDEDEDEDEGGADEEAGGSGDRKRGEVNRHHRLDGEGSKIEDKKGRVTYSALARKKVHLPSTSTSAQKQQFLMSFTVRTEEPPQLSSINKTAFSKEAVIIEVRVRPALAEGVGDRAACSDHSMDSLYGPVVGEVVLLTEIDRRYVPRHRVRSTYESFMAGGGGMPVFRLTREIMSN